jgi:Josephin
MIRLSVFDKAAEWNFHVIRYPSKYSNIPIHQPAGIFTGQVTRFWQICNNISDFKHATTQLTLRLLLRGHSTTTLMKGWNKYVQRHHRRATSLTTKITHWFKKMVKWALHHPLPDPSKFTHQPSSSQPTHATTTPTNARHDTNQPATPTPSGINASTSCADPTTAARNTMQQPSTSQRKRRRGVSEPAANKATHKRIRLDTNMCGLHALNACLHAYNLPVYTPDALFRIAEDIDTHEESTLRQEQNLTPRDLRSLLRTLGTNRNLNGFTLQTLLRAFTHSNLRYSEPRNLPVSELPSTCRAILLHQREPAPLGHFLAVCDRNNSWQLWDSASCTQSFTSLADMLFFVSAFSTVVITCTP